IDKDFSMIYDTLYKAESIYNPKHMYWNYFLHHHQIISSSPFANAIGFTTETVTPAIESLEILPAEQTIRAGYSGNVRTIVTYTGAIDTSVTYKITGNSSANTTVDNDGN